MAAVVTQAPIDSPAGIRFTTGTITFDSGYPTGGESVSITQWGGGLNGIPNRLPDFVVFNNQTPTTTNPVVAYVKATGKVTAYGTAASAIGITEVANAQSLSTQVNEFLAVWVSPTVPVASV